MRVRSTLLRLAFNALVQYWSKFLSHDMYAWAASTLKFQLRPRRFWNEKTRFNPYRYQIQYKYSAGTAHDTL
jgi:hypothetical protein